MRKRLDRDSLKYIAIFAMFLDHIAWGFLTFSSPLAQTFHVLGRITAPIMCFFLAEGYSYTKDKRKYALRLALFAVLSQFAWCFFHGYALTKLSFNMIFTLLLALGAIHVEATVKNPAESVFIIVLICVLSWYSDWHIYAILWSVFFFKFRDREDKKWISFSVVALAYFAETFASAMNANGADKAESLLSSAFAFGVFLAIPLLLSYNGEKGKHRINKWVFYVFYPLHLFVLGAIKYFISF